MNEDMIERASRDYTFRLDESPTNRCYDCDHSSFGSCGLLGIDIANTMKSRCPLWQPIAAAPKEPEPAESPAFDMIAHLRRQREWSERTFGPGSRAAGVVDHIRKELEEIMAAPSDLEEWIDVVILALDGAWRSGATPEAIVAQLVAKQTKNEGRAWPDWRTADPNAAIQHVKPAESPAALDHDMTMDEAEQLLAMTDPESPAEPAQDDEAAIGAWMRSVVVLRDDAEGHRFAIRSATETERFMHRLAREKADLRDQLTIAAKQVDVLKSEGDEFLAERDSAWRERDALRAELASAQGSLDALRKFLQEQPDAGEPHTHPAKLPVGRVIGVVADLRAKLAAAERDANELRGVMVSVDKFLDDEADLAENPATRAARAREIALGWCDDAERTCADLRAKLAAETERADRMERASADRGQWYLESQAKLDAAEARIAEMRAVAWSYPTYDLEGARTALRRIAELGKGMR